MANLYSRTVTITGPSHERTGSEHGGTAQAPPARAGLTRRTDTITGPSLERTGGEHDGIAQAPAARAGLTSLLVTPDWRSQGSVGPNHNDQRPGRATNYRWVQYRRLR